MNAPQNLTLPPNPPGVRLLTNADSTSLSRRSPISSAYSPQNCVTCKGKGTFLWRGPDGSPATYDCSCTEQYMLFRYLLNSGVPLVYQRLGWADYTALSPSVIQQVGDYLMHRDRFIDAGFGLVLHGSRGNGKTLLANLLLKEMIGDGLNCYATTFEDMVESFASGWRDPDQERWFNQIIRNARVLYIDDVGRERKNDRFGDAKLSDDQRRTAAMADNRPGSMKESLLETVIRHRVGNSLPTIISTNYTPDEITTGYGGHTMSLLGERSIFINVTGADSRPDMRQREQDLVIAGMTRPVVIDTITDPA